MRWLTAAGVVLFVLVVSIGCVSGPSGSWTMTTSSNGVVTGTQTVEVKEAQEYDASKYSATIQADKLAWVCKVSNPSNKRTKCMGDINFLTEPLGSINLKFESSVEANKVDEELLSTIPVEGMPAGTKIVRKLNAIVLIGAGCETPTTHVPGNWPVLPLASKATFSPAIAEKTIVIPAPKLSVDVTGIEINEKGGKKFFWVVTAENLEDKMIDVTITVYWVFNTDEKVEATPLSFILNAKEKRLVNGPPVRTKKEFREVAGEAKLTGKKYVKPLP